MTCFYCGTELPPGAMFCGECGRPVASKAVRTSASRASSTEIVAESEDSVERHELHEPAGQVSEDGAPDFAQWSSVGLVDDAASSPLVESVSPPEVDAEADVDADALDELPPPPVPDPVREPTPLLPVLEEGEPAVGDVVEAGDRCAQCGARLASSDIFCPECGFVRQRTGGRSRPSDTVVLDPFPWGLPPAQRQGAVVTPVLEELDTALDESPATVVEQPVVEEIAVEEEPLADEPLAAEELPAVDPAGFAEDEDVDETRIVERGVKGERFVLQFSTGESVRVSGTGLIGRNPIAEPGEYFDSLVTIVDPGKSVSKTHLEFGQEGGAFWISDRFSGNGTVVREPDSQPKRCDAGKRYRVVRGSRVEIGEQFFIVS